MEKVRRLVVRERGYFKVTRGMQKRDFLCSFCLSTSGIYLDPAPDPFESLRYIPRCIEGF